MEFLIAGKVMVTAMVTVTAMVAVMAMVMGTRRNINVKALCTV